MSGAMVTGGQIVETRKDFFPAHIPLLQPLVRKTSSIWTTSVAAAGTQACSGPWVGCQPLCGEHTGHTCEEFTGLSSLVNTGGRMNSPSIAQLGHPRADFCHSHSNAPALLLKAEDNPWLSSA